MDPLPRLAARVFEQAPEALEFSPRHVRTHAGKLNLRAAPDRSAEVLQQLDAGSIVKTSAVRGEWLRVTTPANISGWIHKAYQEEPSSRGRWQAVAPTLLLDSLGSRPRPVALVDGDDELDVIGSHATHLLVRAAEGGQEGWIAGPLPDFVAGTIVVASDGGDGKSRSSGGSSGAYE